MKFHFNFHYSSVFGETLFIRFDSSETHDAIEFPLNYINEGLWRTDLERDELPSADKWVYDVVVKNANARVLAHRNQIDLTKIKSELVHIHDEPVNESEFLLHQKPFPLLWKQTKSKKKDDKKPDFIMYLQLPAMHPDHIPCVSGESKKFGKWTGAPLLFHFKEDRWLLKLKLSKEKITPEFKIAIYDRKKKEIINWEAGENRKLEFLPSENETIILHAVPDLKIDLWKAAGINIPLTALNTENTWGCGDFTSLKMLSDWCRKSHIKMIQLLPLYDTTAAHTKADSYPYAPVSAFALHPVFMDVHQLLRLYNIELTDEMEQNISDVKSAERFHITDVMDLKIKVLRHIYDQVNSAFKDDFAWFTFFDLNREWLQPYAAFCYLRDLHQTADFKNWKTLNIYHESEVEDLVSRDNLAYEDICFHYFVQYHLHLQLSDAKEYLSDNDIILKGDLPVGVGRKSVETWMFPHLFHLDKNAGAPPDAFTQSGQNWGFPTYNWKAMEADNYTWLRRRFEHLEIYFDAIRIDHIIGLFRMWSIPVNKKDGRLGIFEPAIGFTEKELREHNIYTSVERLTQPFNEIDTDVIMRKQDDAFHFRINMQQSDSFRNLSDQEQHDLHKLYSVYFNERQYDIWKKKGERTLNALQKLTKMLLCAEDLGMVPSMVENALQEKGILCLRVERMPVNNEQLFSPSKASYLSVVTPSTHDMSTLREWWQEKEAPIQYYYNFQLQQDGLAPEVLDTATAKLIFAKHLHAPAMFSVFLLQDFLSMDDSLKNRKLKEERINDPSDPEFEWSYRMHVSLETLLQSKSFSKEIKKMIKSSGR